MTSFSQGYLKMIKEHVDPEALIDEKGNVVYIDQHVITVPPDECEQIMNQMLGVD